MSTPTLPASRYGSVSEAMRISGLSRSTLHRRAQDGSLPTLRVGKSLRVDLTALAALASGPALTASERIANPEWVAAQLANFTPDDLRRAAEVLMSIAGSMDSRSVA